MRQIIVGPVLQHLSTIGLDRGRVTLATAFYSHRALTSLDIGAESVTMICRLDLDSTEEWRRGFIAPDSLLSFLRAQQRRGAKTSLYCAPTAHAKLYIGNHGALIGSANLTIRGFGGGHEILYRVGGEKTLREVNRRLREYQNTLRNIQDEELEEYVETNRLSVSRSKARTKSKTDQLPKSNRSELHHLGSYDGFLDWLNSVKSEGADTISERAKGQHNLQGHIRRNFHGLRQFLLAFPDEFNRMLNANPNTYKLSKDQAMEEKIRGFVDQFATDEEDFRLDVWKTYLPVECGGHAGRHGGTIGNLNRMLPLVSAYLATKLLA